MKQLLNFGFQYIKKKWYFLYLVIYCGSSIFMIARTWILGNIIDAITKGNQHELLRMVFYFSIMLLLIKILSLFLNRIYLYIETDAAYILNIEIINKLYKVSYTNICKEDPVVINQKINNDCNLIIGFCISFFRDVISNIANLLLISVIIICYMPALGIVLFILVCLYIIIYLFSKRKIYKASYEVKEKQTKFFAGLCSIITGIKSIRNNGFAEKVFGKQNHLFDEYYRVLMDRQNILNIYNFASSNISLVAQVYLLLYGGIQVIKENLSIGFLTAAITYFSNIIQSANFFLNLGEKFQETLASYNRLLPYLTMKEIQYGKKRLQKIQSIKFQDVKFKYPGEKYLFCFNERFETGNIYWIEGKNGIGKTTLINLLMGLFGTEYNGVIKINDVDIKELDYRYMVESKISIVEQNPYLLLDSIKNNIYCKEQNIINEQVFSELIDKFKMRDIILRENRYLDNYEYANLSDGEKQKIVILRMLLSDSDVWILDEPTSSLDKESKNILYQELKKRKEKRIIILITHEKPQIYDKIIPIGEYKVE